MQPFLMFILIIKLLTHEGASLTPAFGLSIGVWLLTVCHMKSLFLKFSKCIQFYDKF